MANKVTKVQTINAIIEKYGVDGADKEFLLHEVELINKRNAYKSDKPTKAQRENAETKSAIAEAMTPDCVYTATDIAELMTLSSPQKASSLLSQMVEAGVVVKATVKRRSYFALAGTDIEAVLASANADKAE